MTCLVELTIHSLDRIVAVGPQYWKSGKVAEVGHKFVVQFRRPDIGIG